MIADSKTVGETGAREAILTNKAFCEPLAGYPDLLTADHMAEILGESRRNVYRLADREELPSVRVGRRIYFPKRLVIEALRLGEG